MLFGKRGSSLVEVLIGVVLLVMFAFSLYTSLIYVLNILSRSAGISAIHSILNERIEFVKNLNYSDIGVIGGIPSGVLPVSETYTRDERIITLSFYVRNIDDPFDGTIGGSPNDTAPADYKLVQIHGVCTNCPTGTVQDMAVRISPKGLENSSGNGAIFINVFDASGLALPDAQVSIINTSTTPNVSINDVTDADGFLRIIDTPTSTQSYKISVTKSGYSIDKTYLSGDPDNPNPLKPHATVAGGQITSISFAIDRLASLQFSTTDYFCRPVSGVNFSAEGTKLIGMAPDIKKFSTTSETSASGTASYAIEWDNYTLDWMDPVYVISGLTPYGSSTFTVSAGSVISRKYIVSSSTPRSLLVTLVDSVSYAGIGDAKIILSDGVDTYTATSGIVSFSETDWSSNNYSDKSGIDADGSPGSIVMQESGGFYSTSTTAWLISNTIDFGALVTPEIFSFAPISQPNQTTAGFQIATNNDNSTWNFLGPDGTSNSYYTDTSAIDADHAGNRFLRYKLYMTTLDETQTPVVGGVTIYFSGGCAPSHQSFFEGLSAGNYDLTIEKSGYVTATSTVSISSNTQEASVIMTAN